MVLHNEDYTLSDFKSLLRTCMVTIITWLTVTEGCGKDDLNMFRLLLSQSRLPFLLS